MKRAAWIDGERYAFPPADLVGQGGEAEVYDLHDGRVLKWWKPADHPDFDGMPDAQAAAARRIVEAPARLRALPGNLPSAVVAPCGLALATKQGSALVGYLMPKIAGEPLHSFGEPRWRREHLVDGADLVAALVALRDAIAALHRANVVIGDCNDLNVLVEGRRVHLIDVDSYQLPGFACPMFSERFVDPRLCDAQLAPVRPHDAASDWFAYAAMAFRSLLGVGPWGGVAAACPASQRALRRASVLGAGITYPRAARPLAILPDDLVERFRAIFERDDRTPLALDDLRLRACSACGEAHARVRCPACQTAAQLPPTVVRGNLRWTQIATPALGTRAIGQAAPPSATGGPLGATGDVWLDGGALWRTTRLGPERIGSVLAGQTQAWVGATLGIGFYRAGGYAVGFVFRPDRGGLDDRVALPKLRGRLIAAHATIASDRAWLWLAFEGATTVVVVDAQANVLATQTLADAPWLAGIAGACALGPHLFVPTDDGIVRVELVQGVVTQTRVFAETALLVGAADRLAISPSGLDVIRHRDAIRLQLT